VSALPVPMYMGIDTPFSAASYAPEASCLISSMPCSGALEDAQPIFALRRTAWLPGRPTFGTISELFER